MFWRHAKTAAVARLARPSSTGRQERHLGCFNPSACLDCFSSTSPLSLSLSLCNCLLNLLPFPIHSSILFLFWGNSLSLIIPDPFLISPIQEAGCHQSKQARLASWEPRAEPPFLSFSLIYCCAWRESRTIIQHEQVRYIPKLWRVV